MRFKERMTVGRIVAFCIASLLPFVILGLGVLLLFGGAIVNLSFILTYLLLPLGCMTALFFLIFSKFASGAKILFSFVLLLVFVFLFLFMFITLRFEMLNRFKDEKLAVKYAEHIENFDAMPSLSEIGNPVSTVYYDYFSQMGAIFTCDADYLICRYNAEDYEIQKTLLNENYIFQTQPLSASSHVIDPQINMDGYVFRILSQSDYAMDYPKCMMFIATNDDTCEIIYMSFYDDDLDWIESLEDFLNKDCGWHRVKRINAWSR